MNAVVKARMERATATASKPMAKFGEIRDVKCTSIEMEDVQTDAGVLPEARTRLRFEVVGTRTKFSETFPNTLYGNITEEGFEVLDGIFGDLIERLGGIDVAEGGVIKGATLYNNGRGYMTLVEPREDAPAPAPRRSPQQQSDALIAG